MNATTLKSKIAKMEAGLDNPNIQGAAREALIKALANAKAELSKIENQKSKAKNTVTKSVASKKATRKPVVAPKDVSKPSSAKPSEYSWRKKADLSEFSPITLNCQHYHLPVTEDTRVSLKKTGSTSVVVTAKPGDHIIFDEDGYAVFIMEAQSFKKKCTQKAKPSAQAPKKAAAKPKSAKTNKKTTKPKTGGQGKAAKPSAYMSSINTFSKEVESIRTTYNKPDTDPEKLKQELVELAEKSDQKNYLQFIERKLKRLKTDKVRATKAEIVRIGIAIRPLVQSVRGTLRDAKTDNRKVLEPSLDNLIRWAKSPGQYDLAGVDASAEKAPTVKAKVKAKEKQGFMEWLFSA